MNNKLILITFFAYQSIWCSKRPEEHTAFITTLQAAGRNVKVCLAADKQLPMNAREKKACEKAYRLYLNILAAYFDFLEDGKKD